MDHSAYSAQWGFIVIRVITIEHNIHCPEYVIRATEMDRIAIRVH